MVNFPAYVDGKPPIITLREYDDAEWAQETAVDNTSDGYVAVNINDPKHIIAKLDKEAGKTLDIIFKSAKEKYVSENLDDVVKNAANKK